MSEAPIRVLIVDDEAPARARLRDVLADCAAELPLEIVGEAGTARDALAVMALKPADVLLLDIRMPEIDGIEFAQHLQKLENPPGVIFGFHGLRVIPVSGPSVTPFQPNSGVVVLPSSTAPCSRSRATTGASSFHGPLGSMVFEPRSVGQPRVSSRSLMETGTPSSRPCGAPLAQRFSDCFASFMEEPESRKQNAFKTGLSFSMRCKTARVTSTGESCFLA